MHSGVGGVEGYTGLIFFRSASVSETDEGISMEKKVGQTGTRTGWRSSSVAIREQP